MMYLYCLCSCLDVDIDILLDRDHLNGRGRRGRWVYIYLRNQCLSATIESRSGEVSSIQHYEIKFVSDMLQVGGFLRALRFPPPIKLTTTIFTEILLKVALNTITITSRWCNGQCVRISIIVWQFVGSTTSRVKPKTI